MPRDISHAFCYGSVTEAEFIRFSQLPAMAGFHTGEAAPILCLLVETTYDRF